MKSTENSAKERTLAFMNEHANDSSPVHLFNMHVIHIGINAHSEEKSWEVAEFFAKFMGLMPRETDKAVFSGELTENMKVDSFGTYGHIGFGVSDCEAAIKYFTGRGMTVREETKRLNEDGHCIFTYFNEEICGFAIHLVQD